MLCNHHSHYSHKREKKHEIEMSGPEDEAKEIKPSIERDLMDFDLDFDFDSSWSFDPNPFISNPSSPLLLSSSSPQNPQQPQFPAVDNPSSPLWVFSDGASAADDCPRIFSCNTDPVNGNIALENDKRKPSHASTVASMTVAENLDGSSVIKEKMMRALRYFKESTEQHVLVQVWAPVKNGDQYVLTTSEQPFFLDPHSSGLHQYRMASIMYMFSLDGDGDSDLGIPGRVFRQKWPEWSPNVQYYSSKEYPRLNHALHYNVRGTLALPVFDPSGQSCVGVVELIMTAQKINYASEVDKVCKALEAVNLKSSEILDHPHRQICSEGGQDALAEILEILTMVCETHKLPLAQTWVPCRHRNVLAYGGGSKKSCTSSDGSCMGQVCMSTTDVAFYVVDAHMWGFRDACAEHHLQKGQGVAGRAFSEHRACFSRDITQFSKTEYPLVHYARIFGLVSCLAVCLRSTHTGSDDYILEFFLPPNCRDGKEQQALLDSLLDTMKQCFRSLEALTERDLQEEVSLEVIEKTINEKLDMKLEHNQSRNCEIHLQTTPEAKISQGLDDLLNGRDLSPDMLGKHLMNEVGAQVSNKEPVNVDGNRTNISLSDSKSTRNKSIRKRGKTEKSISLEVLQQYFAGSLKDAAKSLGVCPTTMKRICRQHGITRWPSRKINKVNRSLSKLQRVIESVQGGEGAFSLSSFASKPLPVAIGSSSCPVNLKGPEQNLAGCRPSDLQAERGSESPACKTPETDNHGNIHQELSHERSVFQSVPVKDFNGFKTGSSSGEESMDTPISQGSCQNSPANETDLNNPHVSSIQEVVNISSSLGLPFQPSGGEINIPVIYPVPEALVRTQPQTLLNTMLVEDTGSCKDLRDLCNSKAECCQDEQTMAQSTKDVESVTIKAVYKQDIVRFRLPITSGASDLNQEVAKRLKLEVGTYDIKYMDDDQEWVLLVCDADLQECMEISRSSGRHMIRLLVHDIVANRGSSCESSGEWV